MAATNVAKGPGGQYHGDGSPIGSLVAPAGSTFQANDGGYYFKGSGGLPYSDGTDWTSGGWVLVGGGGGQPVSGAAVHLDGGTSTYLSTPAPTFTPTTGLAMYWVGAPDVLVSGGTQTLIASTGFGTLDRSRQLLLNAAGKLSLTYSTDGATNITVTQATAIPGAGNGVNIGLGCTFLFNNGAGGGTVTWYYSADLGATWTSFGTPTTTTGTAAVHSTDKATTIGLSTAFTQAYVGTVIKAWELNAVAGIRISSVDFTGHWLNTDPQGHVWALNGSGYYWVPINDPASLTAAIASGDAATLVAADAYTDAAVSAAGAPSWGLKTTDTLLAQSSTSLVADPNLHVAVAASATYHVEVYLLYDASTTADLKCGWTFPTGATMTWSADALKSGATTATDSPTRSTTTIALGLVLGGAGVATALYGTLRGTLITSSTAGTLTLTNAQNVSEATQVTVRASSWLRLQRIV